MFTLAIIKSDSSEHRHTHTHKSFAWCGKVSIKCKMEVNLLKSCCHGPAKNLITQLHTAHTCCEQLGGWWVNILPSSFHASSGFHPWRSTEGLMMIISIPPWISTVTWSILRIVSFKVIWFLARQKSQKRLETGSNYDSGLCVFSLLVINLERFGRWQLQQGLNMCARIRCRRLF